MQNTLTSFVRVYFVKLLVQLHRATRSLIILHLSITGSFLDVIGSVLCIYIYLYYMKSYSFGSSMVMFFFKFAWINARAEYLCVWHIKYKIRIHTEWYISLSFPFHIYENVTTKKYGKWCIETNLMCFNRGHRFLLLFRLNQKVGNFWHVTLWCYGREQWKMRCAVL